jgi:hypothetical protein
MVVGDREWIYWPLPETLANATEQVHQSARSRMANLRYYPSTYLESRSFQLTLLRPQQELQFLKSATDSPKHLPVSLDSPSPSSIAQ